MNICPQIHCYKEWALLALLTILFRESFKIGADIKLKIHEGENSFSNIYRFYSKSILYLTVFSIINDFWYYWCHI